MKHITALLLIFALISCKKEAQKEFLISNITHINETEVYLSYGIGATSKTDTIKVRNGAFIVNAAPEDAETATLFFPKSNKLVSFYADADSRLKIAGDLSSVATIEVQGDSVNNQLTTYKRSVASVAKALERANAKADKAWQADSLKQYEQLLYAPTVMITRAELRDKTTQFIAKNATTHQALLAARYYLQLTNDAQAITSWWTNLKGEKVKEFSTFLEFKKYYKHALPLNVGRNLAAFQAYNLENKQEYFSNGSGKKTLILFWSSADKYSTYLNKKISLANEKLAKDSLVYTAISLDDSFDEWKSAAKELKGKQLILRNGIQNEAFKSIGVVQTSTLIAIGKDGKIAKVYGLGENPLK